MPWQRDYARVKVDEKAGERWFCDEGAVSVFGGLSVGAAERA
jgi:hypothetical protein